jgi:hypothetical protein
MHRSRQIPATGLVYLPHVSSKKHVADRLMIAHHKSRKIAFRGRIATLSGVFSRSHQFWKHGQSFAVPYCARRKDARGCTRLPCTTRDRDILPEPDGCAKTAGHRAKVFHCSARAPVFVSFCLQVSGGSATLRDPNLLKPPREAWSDTCCNHVHHLDTHDQ